MSPSPLHAPTRIGGYDVEGELGRGAMSVVYRARRGSDHFAIKWMARETQTDALDVHLQFRREAAAVARLDHPALVRILEVGEWEGRPYLVMELAEGEALDARIARGSLADDEVVAIARGLADALSAVHRLGLVHRDIKPGNIILQSEGRLRLIDFGLVTGGTETDAAVGTLPYASPEQLGVTRRPVGPASDLYALGATLFECLVGSPPFEAPNASDFLHLLATRPAPSLMELRPATRPGLAAIIARLLAKDPDDRYQSARGLLFDLDDLPRLDKAFGAGLQPRLGTRDASLATDSLTPLVGRKGESGRLLSAWKHASEGRPALVWIEGESGGGKTRLAQELFLEAEASGALILVGKCQENEAIPFGPLREAADQHVARVLHLDPEAREAATAALRAAAGEWTPLVKRLSLGLARILGDAEEMRPLEPDAEQQRYYEAIASFFRNLGGPGAPLLLLVDDVQWLDEGSLRVLGRIAADPAPAHLLLLATSRNTAGYEEARGRFKDVVGTRLLQRLDLRPLGRDAVEELIRVKLGGRALNAPAVDKLNALTHGNAFAVGEYLRALLDADVIRPVAGSWYADPTAIDAVQLPRDVVALVLGRFHALSPETSRLASLAGIVGGRFSVELLRGVSGVTAEVLSHALEEMVRASIVERSYEGTFTFVHDRVREAAIERLSHEERRDAHQIVAETLDVPGERSAADLYALARHYAEGHIARNPQRVAECNLEAGLTALEEHANEEAFLLLDRVLVVSRGTDIYARMAMRLLEGLGRACAMTGRLDRAFEHLEEALRLSADARDRFRLQYLLCLTYASQGRNDEALDALYSAFLMIGRPYPRTAVVQALSLVVLWLLALLLRTTGIGHGRARGEDRERRRILSQLHYSGSMIALFQGRPFLMVQFIVRDYHNVHFLGPTAETAIASSVYGAAMGLLGLRRVMERYTQLGVAMAEQLGDRSAHAVAKVYQAAGTKWAGDLIQGNDLMLAVLPEVQRHAPGSWYASMAMAEQAYSFLHMGRSTEAIELVRTNLSQIERTNNLMFRYNDVSVQYAETMVQGDTSEATHLWARLEEQYPPISKTIYVRLARCIAVLEVMVDQEETGAALDEAVEAFHDLVSEDYYSNMARVLIGYARVIQYEQADDEGRPAARARLRAATRSLGLRAMVPVFACHPPIWRATLHRHEGRFTSAARCLEKADRLASRCGSRRGAFYVALERARLARDSGDSAARFFAMQALELARSERWKLKAQRVVSEFKLSTDRAQTLSRATVHSTVGGGLSPEQARRYADALLQVSLASASSLEPEVMARNALHELARVLGAERALFFLLDPETAELKLMAQAGAGAETISRTVVRKVLETKAPLVLTGTDKDEDIDKGSILAHGLRSILAAPLLLRDRLLGVVYLDSRLARSMFTEADVDLLLGVSNHIAIAVETARNARVEAERSAMQRDLALLGAVQTLLLPKSPVFTMKGLQGAGFYQPATQSGGDWWWYEALQDGRCLLLVGDVSGHGAASAMITGAVAGAFRALFDQVGEMAPPALIAALDHQVRAFGGEFHMTLSVLVLDAERRQIRWWNAAAPPIFVLYGGKARSFSNRGNMLGGDLDLVVHEQILPFAEGDRLLVCTDGLLEMKVASGREFGARRTLSLLNSTSGVPIEALPGRLGREINSLLGGREQDDDITFVVLEATPVSPSPQPPSADARHVMQSLEKPHFSSS